MCKCCTTLPVHQTHTQLGSSGRSLATEMTLAKTSMKVLVPSLSRTLPGFLLFLPADWFACSFSVRALSHPERVVLQGCERGRALPLVPVGGPAIQNIRSVRSVPPQDTQDVRRRRRPKRRSRTRNQQIAEETPTTLKLGSGTGATARPPAVAWSEDGQGALL